MRLHRKPTPTDIEAARERHPSSGGDPYTCLHCGEPLRYTGIAGGDVFVHLSTGDMWCLAPTDTGKLRPALPTDRPITKGGEQ